MILRAFLVLAPLIALPSIYAAAQSSSHPGAEKALAQIVLKKDFSDGLELRSRESVTFLENPRVPGLNGLLFMRWKGADPSVEITASVQWFEKASDLLAFYRTEKARTAHGLRIVGDTVVWKTSEQSYLWTDGEHFVIGLGGSPTPSQEMLLAWLDQIESNPPDLAPVRTVTP
ncbi:MAG: hypothetical protein AAF385_02260 [Pseudomonadota bacterium]